MWGMTLIEQAIADLHFAVRRLRRRPGFAIATIAVAALGIGATTAVFSAIDAALLRPLPFVQPENLYTLTNVGIPFEMGGVPQSAGPHSFDINDVMAMRDVFTSVAAYAAGGLNLSESTNPQRVRAGVVTTGFFSTLGVRPQLGRTFDASEGRPYGPHAVILSDAFWRSHFGKQNVLGTSINLNGKSYSVIGVMNPGFSFPNESDIWIPLSVPNTDESFEAFRGWLPTTIVARAAPGITNEIASARILTRWAQLMGPTDASTSAYQQNFDQARTKGAAIPLQRTLVGNTQKALVILMGATALLLLIACANLANLLLSDAAGRNREVALREVLGASRGRIVRQLLAESVLLSLTGAVLGVLLAPVVLGVLRAMMPADLAGIAPAELNLRVLAFATALAVLTGIALGMWPAISATRDDAAETIKSGGSGGATASRMGRVRNMLIGGELGLTVMLLIGSGLMLRSYDKVMSQDIGMDPSHVASLELSFPARTRSAEITRRIQAILRPLEADPSIESAGAVNDLPLRGSSGISVNVEIDGTPKATSVNDMKFARLLAATGGYFKTMGIPLLRGRTFTASDADSLSPQVAVISAEMAKRYWPNGEALGRTFHMQNQYTVIGIVADVHERSLEGKATPQMYFPMGRMGMQNAGIIVRGSLAPNALLARMRDAVHAVDPAQAVYNVRMMDAAVSNAVLPRRTNTTLIVIFGALALLLSAFGVYAVVSYSVTRRAREFGIRAALGATASDIASLVGREMGIVVAIGLALGLGGAWALTRVMSSLLYEVGAHDLTTFLAAPLVLLIPAAIATYVPARRAMSVSPTEVMRAE